MLTAAEVINRLGLQPLPGEGGFYRETYRSRLCLPSNVLTNAYNGGRQVCTAIFYLLTPETFSAMHRLPGDEIYRFYAGDAVEMLQLRRDGTAQLIQIGNDLAAGMVPQVVVPGGVWQGSRLAAGGAYALLGTTMAPGFEFADYTPGAHGALAAQYPDYAEMIRALTCE